MRGSVSWEAQEAETDATPRSVYADTGCGKRCYCSIKKARNAHLRVANRIRVYWCDDCNAFHVTDQEYR